MARESRRQIVPTGAGNSRVAKAAAQFARAEKNRQKKAAQANKRNKRGNGQGTF